MRTLIRNQDLKTLFAGAGFAVGLGLVIGAAMQPSLNVGEGPQGPQMLAGESGPRRAADQHPYAVYAAFPTTVPDYVIGSDWLKPPAPDESVYEETAAIGDETPAYEVAVAPEAPVAPEARSADQVQDQAELEELAAATPG